PVIDALEAGQAVGTPQEHAKATLAPKITKEEGPIDWTQPAVVIHNRVRGLQPWPLASTTLAARRLVLRRTGVRSSSGPRDQVSVLAQGSGLRSAPGDRSVESVLDLTPGAERRPGPWRPGTVLRARGDELVVACGTGTALQIFEIQPEGKRTMTAREFLTGRRVAEGDRFGT